MNFIFNIKILDYLIIVCAQLQTGISALFIGQLTRSLEFITSLTRQLHIPLFLSSPDPQTKNEYYIINVYPHYTATSQAFSDLITFQQWAELTIITEHAESKVNELRKSIFFFIFFRFTLFPRFIAITFGYQSNESYSQTITRSTGN
jgi:hypothetical protein